MNNTISTNPWPGLGSYDESGRYMFCGRRKATNELYSLISDHNVVSLYGRSGIGKTSLLKAGVMPLLLRRGYLPIYVRLSQEEKTPDENGRTLTYSECVVRCMESKMKENGFTQNNTLKKTIEPDGPSFLWSYFCKVSFQSSEGNPCTPVIILDQYEEIFQDQREKAALLMRQLYALVDDSRRLPDDLDYDDFRNRFRFVMSFRDDSLFRLEDVINEYNLTAFKENRYLLKALSRDETMNVITEPAEGLVDENVSKQILDKVVSMSDGISVDPAILSLLMYGLYDRMTQTGDTAIRSALVGEAGDDIVRSFYEQGMAGIGITARKFLEEHLVSSDGRRRSVAVADLKAHVNDKDLEMLTGRHILTRLERGRFTDYELTHDVLCPIVAASRADTLAKEKIAKNKRLARIMAAIAVVVLAIVAVFFFQNRRLKEQRWTALANQSRFVAEKALQLAENGDVCLAKILLLNTIPYDIGKPERPLTAESASALGTVFDNESDILIGHTDFIYSASYSPDGKHIVSASWDNTLRIWDAATGECLKVLILKGHNGFLFSASYSPDGKYIMSESRDYVDNRDTIKIWDAATGECLKALEGGSASFSPDGKHFVYASSDNTVRIWDWATGECLKALEGGSASFSPDGKHIVYVSGDTMGIWDWATGECLKVLEGHTDGYSVVSYSPDGKYIMSESINNTVRIWDAATGECLKALKIDRYSKPLPCSSASFSPDGKYIVSPSSDNTVRIWDAATGECLKTLEGHTSTVISASYSPDGKHIVSASLDKTVRIWGETTEDCLKTLEGHTNDINSVSYSPNGKYIVSASNDDTIRIWDATTGECMKTLEGHTHGVNSASYSPDGKHIVSASDDKTVRIWDAVTGECLKTLVGHTHGVNSASYSTDGKHIVSASDDKTIRIWDAATGERLKTLVGHTAVHSASYSPDGKYIVSASNDDTIRIWDATTGECMKTLEGHLGNIYSASFSPDGKTIVSASEDIILSEIYEEIESDGTARLLAPAHATVKIWDVETGTCLKTLEGHTNEVYSAAFSPDGKTIVSASRDATVKIWDVETGTCLKTLEGHTDEVYSAAFSPDGKHIVSASDDGTIKIWKALPSFKQMLETTRERFKDRELTPEERHQYYLE